MAYCIYIKKCIKILLCFVKRLYHPAIKSIYLLQFFFRSIAFEIFKISIIPKHFEKATNIAVLYILSKVYFSVYIPLTSD